MSRVGTTSLESDHTPLEWYAYVSRVKNLDLVISGLSFFNIKAIPGYLSLTKEHYQDDFLLNTRLAFFECRVSSKTGFLLKKVFLHLSVIRCKRFVLQRLQSMQQKANTIGPATSIRESVIALKRGGR